MVNKGITYHFIFDKEYIDYNLDEDENTLRVIVERKKDAPNREALSMAK